MVASCVIDITLLYKVKFEVTKGVIISRESKKVISIWSKEKYNQLSTKYYAENNRSSNMNPKSSGLHSGSPEGYPIPVSLVAPVMLLLNVTNIV